MKLLISLLLLIGSFAAAEDLSSDCTFPAPQYSSDVGGHGPQVFYFPLDSAIARVDPSKTSFFRITSSWSYVIRDATFLLRYHYEVTKVDGAPILAPWPEIGLMTFTIPALQIRRPLKLSEDIESEWPSASVCGRHQLPVVMLDPAGTESFVGQILIP